MVYVVGFRYRLATPPATGPLLFQHSRDVAGVEGSPCGFLSGPPLLLSDTVTLKVCGLVTSLIFAYFFSIRDFPRGCPALACPHTFRICLPPFSQRFSQRLAVCVSIPFLLLAYTFWVSCLITALTFCGLSPCHLLLLVVHTSVSQTEWPPAPLGTGLLRTGAQDRRPYCRPQIAEPLPL